jgi:hypothetical protein
MKSQLEDDLKAATSRQERRRIQQRLEVDKKIQYHKSEVRRWEGKANRAGEELKQLESLNEDGLFCVE